MPEQVKLPDLGEGIEEGEVLNILVKVGDQINKEEPILEMETDKAMFEVPSPVSGKVLEIHIEEGQKLKVDSLLITVDPAEIAGQDQKETNVKEDAGQQEQEELPLQTKSTEEEQEKIEIEPEKVPPTEPIAQSVSSAAVRTPIDVSEGQILAGPAARRKAREMGIDLSDVTGTGPGGRISQEDVENFTKQPSEAAVAHSEPGENLKAAAGDTGKDDYGNIDIVPFRSIRRKTAEHVFKAWNQMPHVTQFDMADITDLDSLVKKYNETNKNNGIKLTMTAYAVKAVVHIMKEFPQFNAELLVEEEKLIYKNYYNIGIAVDTPRGLMVPVLKNADSMTLSDTAKEIVRLAELSRNGKIEIGDLRGGTFTITNLGGIGGTYFTPIVNYPETAILGISRSRYEPKFIGDELNNRLVLPFSVSYDHRVIDGADGARFTRRLAEIFENPLQFLIDE